MLLAAHAELRAAVAAYEPLIAAEPRGEDVNGVNAVELRAAQERVEALWQLRAKLSGWLRPSWPPRASLVADWFSVEDSAYDELSDTPRP